MIRVTATGGGGSSPSDRCYPKLPKSQSPGLPCPRLQFTEVPANLPEVTMPAQSFSSHGKPTKSSPVLSCAELDDARN